MSQVASKPMTSSEFLAWEAQQELKWEFDGTQPVAMTGGTYAHTRIQGNLITALNIRLRGRPCQPCGPDMRVPTIPGRYCYPDALVTCTPPALDGIEVADPVVIFKVLSASTSGDDRTVKLREYQSLPSVQRYVMLEQDRAFATIITRTGSGWGLALVGPDGVLAMPELGIEVPIAELYDGLALNVVA